MTTEETKPVEREAFEQLRDHLSTEDYALVLAVVDAAMERAAQIANEAGIVTFDEECFKVERAIRALKGRE